MIPATPPNASVFLCALCALCVLCVLCVASGASALDDAYGNAE